MLSFISLCLLSYHHISVPVCEKISEGIFRGNKSCKRNAAIPMGGG